MCIHVFLNYEHFLKAWKDMHHNVVNNLLWAVRMNGCLFLLMAVYSKTKQDPAGTHQYQASRVFHFLFVKKSLRLLGLSPVPRSWLKQLIIREVEKQKQKENSQAKICNNNLIGQPLKRVTGPQVPPQRM